MNDKKEWSWDSSEETLVVENLSTWMGVVLDKEEAHNLYLYLGYIFEEDEQ